MTTPKPTEKGIIHRNSVRMVAQPAVVDCHGAQSKGGAISVVPLMEGDRVMGLEIRCSCGANTLVECVYTPETTQ